MLDALCPKLAQSTCHMVKGQCDGDEHVGLVQHCSITHVVLYMLSKCMPTLNYCINFQDCDDPGETDTPFDYCLVLRKWMDINPAFEFRCFVRNKELVGKYLCSSLLYTESLFSKSPVICTVASKTG